MDKIEVNIAREMIKSKEIDFANGSSKAIVSIDFIEKLMHEYHNIKVNDTLGSVSKKYHCVTKRGCLEQCDDCSLIELSTPF